MLALHDGVARISLRAKEVMLRLHQRTLLLLLITRNLQIRETLIADECAGGRLQQCNWMPEYGAWMVEATPAQPFGDTTVYFRDTFSDMIYNCASPHKSWGYPEISTSLNPVDSQARTGASGGLSRAAALSTQCCSEAQRNSVDHDGLHNLPN